ncbi:MAG: D-alanyl-D-alanine carboxypeptidase/D-alanyl-D-alanine-endopeptidase [Bacteroidales bacterium]|nr:D-alanyl-D-alanine carboxypeptidase/D-alanyl-D-alanine-endopeptidase [Bacteroidales bacterium]
MRNLSKVTLLFLIFIILIGCLPKDQEVSAQVQEKAEQLIEDLIHAEMLTHATLSIKAVDVSSGEVLAAHNSSLTMIPASIQKLLTTATALETLSSGNTFSTTLEYSGHLNKNGTLAGNLYITGGGDPALGSSNFKGHYGDIFERLANAVVAAGINKVEGKIIGDASIFGEINIPGNWIWEDIGNYYGAPATGLNIYDNSFEITFSTQNKAGTPATITGIHPQIPGLEIENRVVASDDNGDNAYIYGTYLSGKRIISGTIPANRKAFTIRGAIPDPAFLAAHQLTEKLKGIGLIVKGNPESMYIDSQPGKRTVLLEIKSPSLNEIIDATNHKSINLYAETLLLHLTPGENAPSDEHALQFVKSFWEEKGMPVSGMFLTDGSGLSRANGMTADQMIFLLNYMNIQSECSAEFKTSLPVSGVSGNMTNFGTGTFLENNLAAKSGSMSRVLNYAGYLTTASGREVAFVVMVNNYEGSSSQVKNLVINFLLDLTSTF